MRRLLVTLPIANLAVTAVWGSVLGVLLPLRLADLDEAHKAGDLALVTATAALFAMAAQPVVGALSDRTRSTFGRRRPWIAGGGVLGGLAICGLSVAGSTATILVLLVLGQICFNAAQGPLSAILPDQVPTTRRGTFSAWIGLGVLAGSVGGQVAGSAFSHAVAAGFATVAATATAVLLAFVALHREPPPPRAAPESFRWRALVASLWVDPRRHPDFAWAFSGRLLLYTGFFVVSTFELYLFEEYLGLTRERAVALVPRVGALSAVGVLVAALVCGPLSDRTGRRKVFVVVGALVLAAGTGLPWASPTAAGALAFGVVGGLGFGCFLAVDGALVTEVLPSAADHAKDLGLVNVAQTLPQTLAPGLAGALVLGFGYAGLFPVAMVLVLAGGLLVLPIRSAR